MQAERFNGSFRDPRQLQPLRSLMMCVCCVVVVEK